MTTVKKHPGIGARHQRFDVMSSSDYERVDMLKAYESGKIVLLENCGFDLDYGLFEGVHIVDHADKHVNYIISKLSMADYLEILWGPEDRFRALEKGGERSPRTSEDEQTFAELKRHLRAVTFNDVELRYRLARQILNFQKQVLDFYQKVFPEYGYYKYSINWRLRESRAESMHVDAYRIDRDFHQVKLFINLDTAPRIWNTGEDMQLLISRHLDDMKLREYLGLQYHRFLEECDRLLFDPVKGPPDCQYFDTTFFDTGDVWTAETRNIPHQIFFGRKMVSVQFYVDPSTRVAPETAMANYVHQLASK